MNIEFKLLHPEAIKPKFQTAGAAAVDLHAIDGEYVYPGERRLFKTGIAVAVPRGYVGLICSRSGLAWKNGVAVLNAPGVIDSDYRGELGVVLVNHSLRDSFFVAPGDRIAQFMVVPQPELNYIQVDELGSTDRGVNGFGSTGM